MENIKATRRLITLYFVLSMFIVVMWIKFNDVARDYSSSARHSLQLWACGPLQRMPDWYTLLDKLDHSNWMDNTIINGTVPFDTVMISRTNDGLIHLTAVELREERTFTYGCSIRRRPDDIYSNNAFERSDSLSAADTLRAICDRYGAAYDDQDAEKTFRELRRKIISQSYTIPQIPFLSLPIDLSIILIATSIFFVELLIIARLDVLHVLDIDPTEVSWVILDSRRDLTDLVAGAVIWAPSVVSLLVGQALWDSQIEGHLEAGWGQSWRKVLPPIVVITSIIGTALWVSARLSLLRKRYRAIIEQEPKRRVHFDPRLK